MAEPDDDLPAAPHDAESLESLKGDGADADTSSVDDAGGAPTRWNWNPVTETGGAPRADVEPKADRSSFEFDLGGALARFGSDGPEPAPAAVPQPEPPVEQAAPVAPQPEAPVAPQPQAPVAPQPEAPVAPQPEAPVVPQPEAPVQEAAPLAPQPQTPAEPVLAVDPPGSVADDLFSDAQPLPRRNRTTPTQEADSTAPNTLPPGRSQPAQPQPEQRQYQPQPDPQPQEYQPQAEPVQPRQYQPQPDPQPQQYQPQPDPQPRQYQPEPSVFDPSPPAPTLPGRSSAYPTHVTPGGPGSAGPSDPVLPPTTVGLPTLPAANPAAPPPIAEPIDSAPSTPDINALRSAQLRANRNQRQGRVFGRSLLAFMVVGGLIAAALIFGRSYLFTTEWDATLTPIVDDIQEAAGVDFDHAVPLVEQPADEYATNLLEQAIGQDWTQRVPEWRALGIANGDVATSTVAAGLAEATPAFYDPASDTIYQVEGIEPDAVRPALESAVLAAYQSQVVADADEASTELVETSQTGLTGVSTPQTLTRRAVDAYVIGRNADQIFGAAASSADSSDLPVPIAYEVAAVDQLGAAILSAAGVDPTTVQLGDDYPDAIYGVLGDNPVNASGFVLAPGDVPLADSAALGTDDWSLVWGSRLPRITVDRLANTVTADSYRPINRGGATCFIGVFQTSTEANGASLFSSMTLWAQRGPVGSQALATQLNPTRVQIEACDPGADVSSTLDDSTVGSLITRQIDRLDG